MKKPYIFASFVDIKKTNLKILNVYKLFKTIKNILKIILFLEKYASKYTYKYSHLKCQFFTIITF